MFWVLLSRYADSYLHVVYGDIQLSLTTRQTYRWTSPFKNPIPIVSMEKIKQTPKPHLDCDDKGGSLWCNGFIFVSG